MQPHFFRYKKKVLRDLLTQQDDDFLKDKLIKKLKGVSYLKAFHKTLVEMEDEA